MNIWKKVAPLCPIHVGGWAQKLDTPITVSTDFQFHFPTTILSLITTFTFTAFSIAISKPLPDFFMLFIKQFLKLILAGMYHTSPYFSFLCMP